MKVSTDLLEFASLSCAALPTTPYSALLQRNPAFVSPSGPMNTPRILDTLPQLPLFDDLYYRMQVSNIDVVNDMIEQMEAELAHELMQNDGIPGPTILAGSAISQMWIFSVYELFRTWRQRCCALLKISDRVSSMSSTERDATLQEESLKLRGADSDASPALSVHRSSVAQLADAQFVVRPRSADAAILPLFRRIEALRVTLAKHEIPKGGGKLARSPGYCRADYMTGSIYWEVELKGNSVDVVNRLEIANELRAIRASAP